MQTLEKDPNANIDKMENTIDELVYELYGISENEIQIIEGKING